MSDLSELTVKHLLTPIQLHAHYSICGIVCVMQQNAGRGMAPMAAPCSTSLATGAG